MVGARAGSGAEPRPAVTRRELIARLRGRFGVRLTVLVAGAGFGKSTTLRQAVAENRLAPSGVDWWLSLRHRDRVPSRLARDLGEALGWPVGDGDDPEASVERALEHLARSSPLGSALVLDDVHLLEASPGARLLRHVVAVAPPSVHIVVASRTPVGWLLPPGTPEPGLAIGEEDLRFADDELADLASLRSAAAEVSGLGDLGGWPALVDLALSFGLRGAVTFVEEEVVELVPPEVREVLAAAVAVGGGSARLLGHALDRPVDTAAIAADLPMTVLDDDGDLQVHPLWGEVLRDPWAPEEAVAVRRRAAEHLLAQGDLERAVPLFADAGDWPAFEAAVAETWRRGYLGVPLDVLASWLERLPPDRHDSPAGTLLRGAAARIQHTFGDEARELLATAVRRNREAGSLPGEMAALGEYGYVCRARGEATQMVEVMTRLAEMASEDPVAAPFVRLTEAAMLDVMGDDAGVLRTLEPLGPEDLSPEWSTAVAFLRLLSAGRQGDPDLTDQACADCIRLGGPGSIHERYTGAIVDWFLGRPATALAALPDPVPEARLSRVDQTMLGSHCATIQGLAGDVARARLALATAGAGSLGAAQASFTAAVAVAEAALAVAEGDEARAADHLREVCGPQGDDPGGLRLLRHFPALPYVLVPETRAPIDAMDLGPALVPARTAARAVVAAREGTGGPAPGTWPPPDQVITALPLRWVAVAAAAAHTRGAVEGALLGQRLVDVHRERGRAALRAEAEGGEWWAEGARGLLGSAGLPPGTTIALGLLGPSSLVVEGRPVVHPDWRRPMVRALCALLVLEGPLDRAQAARELWPEVPPADAAHNLRSHLSLLLDVLEPGRRPGEASFVVRAEGDGLALVGRPHLVADVTDFDRAVARWERTGGLDGLPEALDRWRGEPFSDLPDLPFVGEHRRVRERRFLAAGQAVGEQALVLGRPDDAIDRALQLVRVDPWSERAHQLLVAAHVAAGDRAAARRALQRCRDVLDDLGVPPDPRTELLDRQLRAGPRDR